MVRTPPFHGENLGSTPGSDINPAFKEVIMAEKYEIGGTMYGPGRKNTAHDISILHLVEQELRAEGLSDTDAQALVERVNAKIK